jgi:hypothetical protein
MKRCLKIILLQPIGPMGQMGQGIFLKMGELRMKYVEALIAWDPFENIIEVGQWPDYSGWSDKYLMTSGACYLDLHELSDYELVQRLFSEFHRVVVRDGVSPSVTHQEFMKIDEYRAIIGNE